MKFYTTVLLIVAMIGVASALDSVASPDVHLLNTNTSDVLGNKNDASILIFTTSFVGILFALYLNYIVSSIPLQLTATGGQGSDQSNYSLLAGQSVNGSSSDEELESKSMELRDIYNTIRIGA